MCGGGGAAGPALHASRAPPQHLLRLQLGLLAGGRRALAPPGGLAAPRPLPLPGLGGPGALQTAIQLQLGHHQHI